MHHRQYLSHPQYHSRCRPQYNTQYHPQNESQCYPQTIPQYVPQNNSQCSPQPSPQYSTQCDLQSQPQHSSRYNSQHSSLQNSEFFNDPKYLNLEEKNEIHHLSPLHPNQIQLIANTVAERIKLALRNSPYSPTPYKTKEMRIPSPPVQNVVPLKPHTPQKMKKMRIVSPPVQKVISLTPFPAQRIVTTSLPSQKVPVQSVVTLKIVPVHKVVEMTVPSQETLIQQVAPVHKSIEPEMPSRKLSVKSWFKSFASSLLTASKTALVPKSACTGDTVESAAEVFETHEETNENSSPLTWNSRPLNQSLKSSEVMQDSRPLNRSLKSSEASLPLLNGSRPLKQTIKSSEVLTGSRPLNSMIKSSEVLVARPLKFPAHSNSSVLKETASWKRCKKKHSLVASLESSHIWKGSSLRKVRSWKRKKKKRSRRSKRLFKEFDWDPGAVLKESQTHFCITSSFQCQFTFACLSSFQPLLRQRGRNVTSGFSMETWF